MATLRGRGSVFMLADKFKKGFDRWDNFCSFHLNFVLPLDVGFMPGPLGVSFKYCCRASSTMLLLSNLKCYLPFSI